MQKATKVFCILRKNLQKSVVGCGRKYKNLCELWKNLKKVQKSVVGCGRM